ncbi:hypothetical protein GCM10027614_11850 [Micromonospora vulcania]
MRTSPVREVCSTRRSGRTARLIGSPGKSFSVTFWKLLSGGAAAGAGAAVAADGGTARPAVTSSRADRNAVLFIR